MTRQELNPIPLSPFAYGENERLNVLHPRGGGKEKPVELTELDRRIITAVNQSLLTTPNLMHAHLAQLGWHEHPQIVRSSLEKLFRHKYLTKMEFLTPEGASPTRVYALGRFGKEFLRSVGQVPNRTRFVSNLDAAKAKKLLSCLQYLLYADHISGAEQIHMAPLVTEVVDRNCHTDHLFRPHAVVQLQDRTVLVESVRCEPPALQELCGKLGRMEQTLSGLYQLNMQIRYPVELVLIFEDQFHQDAMERQMLERGWGCDFPVYMTHDAETFSGRGFGERKELYRYPGQKSRMVRLAENLCAIIEKVFE